MPLLFSYFLNLTCMGVKMLPQVCALLEALATHLTRVASVTAVDAQNMRLHVAVPSEKLQADATCVLVADIEVGQLRVIVMFL